MKILLTWLNRFGQSKSILVDQKKKESKDEIKKKK